MGRLWKKSYLPLIALCLTACDSQIADFISSARRGIGGSGGFTPDNSGTPNPSTTPISNLTITSDRPLIAVSYDLTVAPFANPATTPTLAGATISISPAANAGSGSAATNTGVTPTSSIVTATLYVASNYDNFSAFTANFGFTNSPVASTFSTCSFLGVYSGIA